MLRPAETVRVRWSRAAPQDASLRARLASELARLAPALSDMEALVHEANRATGLEHPWLLPRLEARLPIYDWGRRYRIVVTCLEKPRILVTDEVGREVARVELP